MNAYKFNESSYWVYQKEGSMELDSQRVVMAVDNNFVGEYPSACSGGAYVHEFRMKVHSTFNQSNFDYFIIGSNLYKDLSAAGNHKGRIILNSNSDFTENTGTEYVENIATLSINGNHFSDVKKIRLKVLPDNAAYPNISTNEMYFYLVSSIGLIKWEIIEGTTIVETWNLVSWNVIL